ncbi:hypothetical protein BaRGS_00039171 [Batillaria attramentaria]|uniref:Uncharacterized protein n=1 Tax=Batillaria attramentaria TaxID=370345 RepID=A0ABD0J3U3_9CAEN
MHSGWNAVCCLSYRNVSPWLLQLDFQCTNWFLQVLTCDDTDSLKFFEIHSGLADLTKDPYQCLKVNQFDCSANSSLPSRAIAFAFGSVNTLTVLDRPALMA